MQNMATASHQVCVIFPVKRVTYYADTVIFYLCIKTYLKVYADTIIYEIHAESFKLASLVCGPCMNVYIQITSDHL